MTVQIKLNHGLFAIIDDADADLVNRYKWWTKMNVPHLQNWYAYTVIRESPKSTRKTVYMHRLILSAPKDVHVDHVDGNGLNNIRSNIRFCTRGQNMANKRAASKFGYKGVHMLTGVWRAKPYAGRLNGRHLGYFASIEEAARAYDVAALKEYGNFARLNFPQVKCWDES